MDAISTICEYAEELGVGFTVRMEHCMEAVFGCNQQIMSYVYDDLFPRPGGYNPPRVPMHILNIAGR
jgi:hypothetical protein